MFKKVRIGITRTLLTLLSGAVLSSGYYYYKHEENEKHLAELNTAYSELAFNPEVLNKTYTSELTYEYLNTVNTITVDLAKVDNLNELSKMPNIEYLVIESAEWVTPEILDEIRAYGINNITLGFNDINVNKDNLIQLSELTDFECVSMYYYTNDEHNALVYYNNYSDNPYDNIRVRIGGALEFRYLTDAYLSKHNKAEMIWDLSDKKDEYIKYLDDLNTKLDEIITNINFQQDDSDITKMYRIYDYVINRLEYDPDILAYINGEVGRTIRVDNLMKRYAYHGLASILFSSDDVSKGICTTYTDLFDILCYKVNVSTRTQSGFDDHVLGHTWNTYYRADDLVCLDLTSTDNDVTKSYIDYYLSFNTEEERQEHLKEVVSHTLIDPVTYDGMDLSYSYNDLYNKEDIETTYYNQGFDNKTIITNKLFFLKLILLALGGAISLNVVYYFADLMGLSPYDCEDFKDRPKRK